MSERSTSERGLRIAKVTLVHPSGEFDEYAFESSKLNILTGVRNSSKTTTLRVAVADEHVEVGTYLRIHGQPHTLTRYLTQRRMGKVSIDGSEITAVEFSDWILGELGWPNLRIPKGFIRLRPLNRFPCPSATPCVTSTETRTPGRASRTRSMSSSGVLSSASS